MLTRVCTDDFRRLTSCELGFDGLRLMSERVAVGWGDEDEDDSAASVVLPLLLRGYRELLRGADSPGGRSVSD